MTCIGDWRDSLVLNKQGRVRGNYRPNIEVILRHHPDIAGVFSGDVASGNLLVVSCPPWESSCGWEPRPIRDTDYAHARMWFEANGICSNFGFVIRAIENVAKEL